MDELTGEPGEPGGRKRDTVVQDRLARLQALLALSMLTTESRHEPHILHLAVNVIPKLGRCHLGGVFLLDGGWRETAGPCTDPGVRAGVEAQLAAIGGGAAALAIEGEAWSWALPVRSRDSHLGHLVVVATGEPPAGERFLLGVLTQQTGIAIANARLHVSERASAAELRSVNAALAESVAALEYSTTVHARLTRVAVTGEGREGIARVIHEITGFPVAIEDRHGNLRAWAGPGRPDPYPKSLPERRERTLRRALREGHPIWDGGYYLTVARARSDVLGVLALADPDGRAGQREQAALEHGAAVLAMELSHLQSLAETELRIGRDLVEELLSGTGDDGSLLVRAQALGHDLERPHRVVVVGGRDRATPPEVFFGAVRRAAHDTGTGSFPVSRADTVVMLALADRHWEDLRQAVLRHLDTGHCRVGVGGACERPADFARSFREARLALKLQEESAGAEQTTIYDDLGVYRLLAEVEPLASVERFVRRWLGDLIDYDERTHSALVDTLGHYLDAGRRQGETAEALIVHRNTLKYRLQRIAEISRHDLADADTCFSLQLATRAWRTLQALRTTTS